MFEQHCGVSEGPAFVGDDGGGGAGSDDCSGASVDRRDESGGGEGVKKAGETVKYRRPSCPSPRLDWNEAEFAFSFKCTLEMVS